MFHLFLMSTNIRLPSHTIMLPKFQIGTNGSTQPHLSHSIQNVRKCFILTIQSSMRQPPQSYITFLVTSNSFYV